MITNDRFQVTFKGEHDVKIQVTLFIRLDSDSFHAS